MKVKEIQMTKQLTFIMAIVCGISIASLYYIQPLEGLVAKEIGVDVAKIGLAPTLSQMGYALGLLFIVPLGDIFERKKLIMTMLSIVAVVLFITGSTSNYLLLMILMLLIGLSSIVPQLILPFAGQLAKPEERGSVLGIVTGGLLIGILLSRTFSGLVGDAFGWRVVYFAGVALALILIVLVWFMFPRNTPISQMSYGELMKSLPHLFMTQRVVRESAFNGFFAFGAFSIFWSTLIFYMESPAYNLGSKEVGYFGLVGVIGSAASVLMGRVADKKGARFGVGIGSFIAMLSFLVLWIFGSSITGLVVGLTLLDFGTSTTQVSNQSRIQSLGDENRSRNNTIYMFSFFVGGASGSLLGSFAWQLAGWTGVCLLGMIYGLIAIIGHHIIYKPVSK
ncbi:MFS transporter [Vagococcus sp. PNs007]|uniref:MFS transporter n=2 Tax=Vagococcus proximus TaxID=2991417 RepID=A0ABT5X1V8_9ENTE|nr:MFS transporter [Vagococcus proximus]